MEEICVEIECTITERGDEEGRGTGRRGVKEIKCRSEGRVEGW